ncbi:MAG TPA: alkaline phosphatase family protein, partial [Patescibacteria group bacterium]|nr:alkaline phosphatase family protein [Patescibacteria group bacterium]
GIKLLLDQGIVYHQAIMPHGLPTTGPGHTSLNTGTTPHNHGIVSNKWFSKEGHKIAVADDKAFPTFLHEADGKSPQHIMVNGISDGFARNSTRRSPHYVFSVSGKSRSAVCTASALGKALWFDKDIGMFTSSTYYFEKLPAWVNVVNKKQNAYRYNKHLTWKSIFPLKSNAYTAVAPEGYAFTSEKATLVNKTFQVTQAIKKHNKVSLEKATEKKCVYLELTPYMNDYIFDCATACVKEYLLSQKANNMLLWVCISSIDKVGHMMGPDSYEVLDSLYHLDKQIAHFMKKIEKVVKREDTLFVLTADHGMAQIPEQAYKKGFLHARRHKKSELLKELNERIKEKFAITDACIDVQAANVYFDHTKIDAKKVAILQMAKKILREKEYIKNVWTYHELATLPVEKKSIESFFKNQLFANRSGDLIYQIMPNCLIDEYASGASHESPYHDNIHIPLILYQKGSLEKKQITKKVFATQLAGTLSAILEIPGPDIATEEILPDIDR